MTKLIKAVAFDMDGLMVNTEDIYDQVCETLLARRGGAFDLELKLKMMGRPGPVAIEIMKSERGLTDSVEELQMEVETEFHAIMPEIVRPLRGLKKLLDFLERNQIPKCVATSSFRKHAHGVLRECRLEDRFDFVLTAEDVVNGKPSPDIYLLAASGFQIDADEMLVLEDSVQGSKAAVAANAITVAVPGRHSVNCDYHHVVWVAAHLEDPLIYNLFDEQQSS